MHRRQLIAMWCGISVITLTGLFPFVQKPSRRLEIGFLFEDYKFLELAVVLIAWALVTLVTVGLIVTLRDSPSGKNKRS